MNLIDVKNSLMPRNQAFYKESEIVFVEYVKGKFVKFIKSKGDIDGFQEMFTFENNEVLNELESKYNVFILYRNDTVDCNIENY